ncbi:hypothetical protein RND81_10G208300 [Saponaria officinalis]|uniref:Uncharacterized protein n=1 Tax=Saponaria officinalis TaxID=3572 RepID=A0AAW1I5B0_SAPOF
MNHPKQKQIISSSKVVALGLIESITALAYICAKFTRSASHKLACGTFKHNKLKRITGIGKKRTGHDRNYEGESSFGEDGVWRRSILMGDKCEPLDFSGVIYYDCNGNMLSHVPVKSPRASPF